MVVIGDLINKPDDSAQAAEYKRIIARLDPKIPLYSVPGNHDVGNEPTAESLARYREQPCGRLGRWVAPADHSGFISLKLWL